MIQPLIVERPEIVGTFTLRTWNPDGSMAEERVVKNIMCAGGLTVLAQVMNWFGVVDQNTTMGNAFTYQDLTPLYGAIGSGGAVTPSDGDVILEDEVNRSVVYAGGTTPAAPGGTNATVVWDFFYGIPVSTVTITECGVFVNATSTANSGTLLDHAVISPSVSQTNVQTATLSVSFSVGVGSGGALARNALYMVTTDTTMVTNDTGVTVDATSGDVTITLPDTPGTGYIYSVKKQDSSAHTVTVQGSFGNIDNAANVVISTQYVDLTFELDLDGEWWII